VEAHLTVVAFATKFLLSSIAASLEIHLTGIALSLEAHLPRVAFATKFLLVGIVASLGIRLKWAR
jgi:hypothetical protein